MAYPRSRRSRTHKSFLRTAGDLTLNGTSWADLPTIGTTWDAVLQAQVGDSVEVGISAIIGNAAVTAYIDCVTVVAGTVVNSIATGLPPDNSHSGVSAWYGTASITAKSGGSVIYTLAGGDVSAAGTVTLRLRARTSTASNRTLTASLGNPLHFWAKNLGPPSPY